MARAYVPARAEMNDEDLSVLARGGDGEASEELVRRYTELAKGIAYHYRPPGSELEDSQQIALMGLMDAITTFRRGGLSFRNYAYLHMRGEVISAIKAATTCKHRIHPQHLVFVDGEDERNEDLFVAQATDQPEVAVIRRELLDEARERLSPLEWNVSRMFALGFTYDEIGRRLGGMPAKSVDNALTRARRKGCEILECA